MLVATAARRFRGDKHVPIQGADAQALLVEAAAAGFVAQGPRADDGGGPERRFIRSTCAAAALLWHRHAPAAQPAVLLALYNPGS